MATSLLKVEFGYLTRYPAKRSTSDACGGG
jgi:hypothetical protein